MATGGLGPDTEGTTKNRERETGQTARTGGSARGLIPNTRGTAESRRSYLSPASTQLNTKEAPN
jgi:hypothetical protein